MMNTQTNDDLSVQGFSFSCEQRRSTTEYHQHGDEFLRPSEVAIMISNTISRFSCQVLAQMST